MRNRLSDENLEVLAFCNRSIKMVPRDSAADQIRVDAFMDDWENMTPEDEEYCAEFLNSMTVQLDANSDSELDETELDESESDDDETEPGKRNFSGVRLLA